MINVDKCLPKWKMPLGKTLLVEVPGLPAIAICTPINKMHVCHFFESVHIHFCKTLFTYWVAIPRRHWNSGVVSAITNWVMTNPAGRYCWYCCVSPSSCAVWPCYHVFLFPSEGKQQTHERQQLLLTCQKGKECSNSEKRIFRTHVDMNFFSHICSVKNSPSNFGHTF
jgi:hypothetical protein